MAVTGSILADGQLAIATAAVYAVPAATTAYVKSFQLYNTNVAAQTVNIYVNEAGGTDRQIARFVLAQFESATVDFAGPLAATDEIRGDTTTAAAVDYVICGLEET